MPRLLRRLPVSSPRSSSRAVLLLALAAGALRGASAAPADPEPRARPFGLQDSAAAHFAAKETSRLLAAGDVPQALKLAQEAIDKRPDDLVLVEASAESDRWRPLRAVLEDLLRELPPAARARYEELADAAAAPLEAQALASGSDEALRTLWSRFAASRRGVEAARLLVERALERGHARPAAELARRALRSAPGDAGLWLRLVDALALAGDAAGLSSLRPPAGLAVPTSAGPVDVAARLEAALRRLAAEPLATSRAMWGGRTSRDLPFPAGDLPRLSLRWTERTQLELRERDEAGSWSGGDGEDQADFEQHLRSYRALYPALAGRTLYVSDGRSLRALDLLSGRPQWVFDAEGTSLPLLDKRGMSPGRTALERPFAPTVWRDRVIATLEVARPFVPDWLMQVQINSYVQRRTLVAVDRERGTLLWSAGQDPLDRLRIEDVTFVAEPVVSDGLVLTVGAYYRVQQNVALYAFDAVTGRLAWVRPLIYGQQETNLFGNPVKELAAGAVSAADGTAYCLTGLGCVAAVDVADGALLWVASYAHQPIPKVEYWYRAPLRIPRAASSAPLISGDVVVVAPGDGLHVSALDRRKGSLRWRVSHGQLETPFGGLSQVLGAAPVGGRPAVIVSGGQVLALDLAGGTLLARGRQAPVRSLIVGQGVLRGREALVPTEDGLARFDLDAGLQHLGTEPWPPGLESGNLLPSGRVLVVCGRSEVSGLYAWEDLERDLERRRRAQPKDPEVLLEAGELYLRGRGPASARAAFEAALALAAPDSSAAGRARRGLYEAWMAEGDAALRSEVPAEAARAFEGALPQAQSPAERVRARLALDRALAPASEARRANLEQLYGEAGAERAPGEDGGEPLPVRALVLLRLARLEAEAGRPAAAVSALQRLLHEHGELSLAGTPARDVARERIAALMARFGAGVYAAEEAQARERLQGARATGDARGLLEVLELFPNASVVPEALLALAGVELKVGRAVEAGDVLRRLLGRYPSAAEAPAALLRLAEASAAEGALGARRAALRRLLETDALHGAGAPPAALAEQAAAPARPLARPALPLREVLSRPKPDDELPLPLPVAAAADEPAPLALVSEGTTLRAFGLSDGRLRLELPGQAWRRAAYAAGRLVLAARGALLGVDPATGAEAWRRELSDDVLDMAVTDGLVLLWTQVPSAGRAERALEALDPVLGRTLWRTPLGSESYALLRADAGRVVLQRSRTEDGEARLALLVFDALTGALRAELRLGTQREAGGLRLLGDGLLAEVRVEGGGQRTLTLFDLRAGRARWSVLLAGADPATAVARDGARLHVLRLTGRLEAFALEDGAAGPAVTLRLPEEARAIPQQGTALRVEQGRVTLLASAARGPAQLLCLSLADGALRWRELPEGLLRTTMHVLEPLDGFYVVLWAGSAEGEARRVLVHVVRAADGVRMQELEAPSSRADGIASLTAGEASVVLVTGAGTRVYGPADAPAAVPAAGPAAR